MTFAASNSASIFASIFHGKWPPKLDWKSMFFLTKAVSGGQGGGGCRLWLLFGRVLEESDFWWFFDRQKKRPKTQKKQKKRDFGAPGGCRPGLAWGRKARKVICAGCSWSLSVAKRLSKVLQTKSSIKNPPLTPSQKMKGAAPIWPLADLQF